LYSSIYAQQVNNIIILYSLQMVFSIKPFFVPGRIDIKQFGNSWFQSESYHQFCWKPRYKCNWCFIHL